MRRIRFAIAGLAALAPLVSASGAGPWWKNAVVYEIYPRSFQDSNGDGVGDLNGITSRLDYLHGLGIDMIWLSPIYPSPQVDFGYDISDYQAIDPQYGTMADFDRLLSEARKRNIRICMDLVMNHTSDKHPWFVESASSKSNPKRDWYIWRDGKGPGKPPNNWTSIFGHSAWQYDPKTGQYYYHKFYKEQPDLNWRNPEVKNAMFSAVRFWLDKGVAGFRLDAVPTLFEDPDLKDAQVLQGKNAYGDPILDTSLTDNLPEVHDVMRALRRLVDSYPGNRVLIGETYLPNIQELYKWYGGAAGDELQLPMDMQVGFINKLDASEFRARIQDAEAGIGTNRPLFVFDNHDNPRIDARYGDGVHDAAIERMLAAVLFASRGAAMMYYGDEIGMTTHPPTRVQDVKDPIGRTGWPREKGRDGERTPMQWTPGHEAGFTTSNHPWLPVAPDYKKINVAVEQGKTDSLLEWYKQLIALRRDNPALADGDETMLDSSGRNVLSWARRSEGHATAVIACNFSASAQTVDLGAAGNSVRTLLKSPGVADPSSLNKVSLPPFGVYVGETEK